MSVPAMSLSIEPTSPTMLRCLLLSNCSLVTSPAFHQPTGLRAEIGRTTREQGRHVFRPLCTETVRSRE